MISSMYFKDYYGYYVSLFSIYLSSLCDRIFTMTVHTDSCILFTKYWDNRSMNLFRRFPKWLKSVSTSWVWTGSTLKRWIIFTCQCICWSHCPLCSTPCHKKKCLKCLHHPSSILLDNTSFSASIEISLWPKMSLKLSQHLSLFTPHSFGEIFF